MRRCWDRMDDLRTGCVVPRTGWNDCRTRSRGRRTESSVGGIGWVDLGTGNDDCWIRWIVVWTENGETGVQTLVARTGWDDLGTGRNDLATGCVVMQIGSDDCRPEGAMSEPDLTTIPCPRSILRREPVQNVAIWSPSSSFPPRATCHSLRHSFATPSVGGRVRHQDSAGASGPSGRGDHDGIHPCVESGWVRGAEPGRSVGAGGVAFTCRARDRPHALQRHDGRD